MNKYDKDKFNEVIKKEAKSISIDIPEELENRILKSLDELPDKKRKSKLIRIKKSV